MLTRLLRRRHGKISGPAPRRGMALIAVLWIVAALSIMVMGLTRSVQQGIRAAIMQRGLAEGQALGQAAIALALQQLTVQTQTQATPNTGTDQVSINYAGMSIAVTATPLNGWVALNSASAPMLAALLQTAGGLNAARAQQMAEAIVTWRDGVPQQDLASPPTIGNQTRRFEAVEDLMLIPGMDYELYARLAPFMSVSNSSSGPVNANAAPPGLAEALGNNTAFIAPNNAGRGNLFRLEAAVPLEAGTILHLTQDVALQRAGSNTVTPWRILRESARMDAGAAPAASA